MKLLLNALKEWRKKENFKLNNMKQLPLSIFILSTFICYSQAPIKKDSLYCRTPQQEKEVIKIVQQKDILDTLYNNCKSENNALKDAIQYQAMVIQEQGQIIAKTERIVSEKDIIIASKDSDLKIEKGKRRISQIRGALRGAGLGLSLIGNVIMVIKIVGDKL